MGVVYQLTVTENQAEGFLKHGLDFFGGLAVEAEAAAGVTEVADLITLLNGDLPGSPYSPDQPLYILHVPANPFLQARVAVGPMNESAFLGGVIELDPFNGSGVARVGDTSTALLWIEMTRLSQGSQLWRFDPGNPKPTLCGVYHGVAWGWENIETGEFTVAMPTQFVGPVTRRPWGVVPVDVELDEAGISPASVTLIAPGNPPEEKGFEELGSGLWAKRIEYSSDIDIFEYQVSGQVDSLPVRMLRAIKGEQGQLQAHITPVIIDAPLAMTAEFDRYAPGMFTKVVELREVENQTIREARPGSWDSSKRPAITVETSHKRTPNDMQQLLGDIFALTSQVSPEGWETFNLAIQMVDRHIHFAATATVPGKSEGSNSEARSSGEGGSGAGDSATGPNQTEVQPPEEISIRYLPTAILHYCNHIKELQYKPGEGACVELRITFSSDGNATLTLNLDQKPTWADAVPAEAWLADLKRFPREESHIPAWMKEITAA